MCVFARKSLVQKGQIAIRAPWCTNYFVIGKITSFNGSVDIYVEVYDTHTDTFVQLRRYLGFSLYLDSWSYRWTASMVINNLF